MLGDGTKLATTPHNAAPEARLLDLTRLVSRAGRPMTGIDRVEWAYFDHLADAQMPVYALIRTTYGYVLLDRAGMQALRARICGDQPWGVIDTLSRLVRSKPDTVRRAESDLRRFALDRCRPRRLPDMLLRHLPSGTAYLNIGHTNLTDRVLSAVRHGINGRVAVFVHDTIPLDFPQFQREGSVDRFRAFLRQAGAWADLIIYNSSYSAQRAEHWLSAWGTPPQSVVAHLGVEVPDLVDLPIGIVPQTPYFVTVGTIEPRKNHALLLDIWDGFSEDAPHLMICGSRGWNNQDVFSRLDKRPQNHRVSEVSSLTDGQIATLLKGSKGLLFPSLAEGYGLPPIEAAALGVPVLCNTLPVYRETLGDIPVYAEASDRYLWETKIRKLAEAPKPTKTDMERVFDPPDWKTHFNTVLSLT
jgi:glycosyltransferase involved in cell wall biosynthesis